MTLSNAIGGYFELEIGPAGATLPEGAILLNSGRSCLEYILSARRVKRVYIPKYTCDAVLEPLQKLGTPHEFYAVNAMLEPAGIIPVQDDELVIYTNYFGVKDDYCAKAVDLYRGQLLLDCCQAYYYQPSTADVPVFYSPRKFFGVPDGGILAGVGELSKQLPIDTSVGRFAHLIKRIEVGAEAGYADYQASETSIADQPLSLMSKITKEMLSAIDSESARQKRRANFAYLHERLADINKLKLGEAQPAGPLCYPYYVDDGASLRRKLIDSKIFVASYWPNVLEWSKPGDVEHDLAQNILALPIDQRYGESEMGRILELLA
jgi:hypothetical protein